jgi:hypothetical protein
MVCGTFVCVLDLFFKSDLKLGIVYGLVNIELLKK